MCTALRKCALCLLLLQNDVKQYAAQLVCDCSNKPALRKSKQPWSQDRMFVTCYKKE